MEQPRSPDVKPSWDPCILGIRKHKLLKEDILPAMASNRKVQRLLNEFMDLLSEYETSETNLEEKNLGPSTSQLAPDEMNCDISTSEEMKPAPPVATFHQATDDFCSSLLPSDENGCALQTKDQMDSVPQDRDQMDMDLQPTDQSETTPASADQIKLGGPAPENLNPASPAKEGDS